MHNGGVQGAMMQEDSVGAGVMGEGMGKGGGGAGGAGLVPETRMWQKSRSSRRRS